MSPTISTDILSYKAIPVRMPLHYYRSLISHTFHIQDFMNYQIPMCQDTQSTSEIQYGFKDTDCISAVSRYVYWIDVNGNRVDLGQIAEANSPRTRRDTYEWRIIQAWDLQIAESKQAWFIDATEVFSGTENSELISVASRAGDASETNTVELNCHQFIQALDGYQLQHQRDSISYLHIVSIDNWREDTRTHMSVTVTSPAMPTLAIVQR